jgi:hypothetical protein
MDEYAGARPSSKSGHSMVDEDGLSDMAASTASLWDSPEHVQLTINHLSTTLAGGHHTSYHLLASFQIFW